MIALRRTVKPIGYPVDVDDVKTTGRISTTAHNSMILGLISAATEAVEQICNRSLITQTWEYVIGNFMWEQLQLPRPRLISVTGVQYIDTNGDEQTASSSLYQINTNSEPGIIMIQPGSQWPAVGSGYTEPVTITYIAGYGGADDVPEPIKQAIIALSVHWYIDGISAAVPDGIHRLLDNYRVLYEL